MPFSHVLAGQQFTDANFAGTAYANEQTGFPKALEKIVEHVANAYRSASSTSLAVGTGAKTLTVAANRPFAVGQPVRIASTADPVNTFMDGSVTAYTDATGVMTVQVTSAKGTGTFASWMLSIGGYAQVVASPSPLPVASGGTGASTADAALTNLGALKTANNLSELTASAATVRTNLGLGTVAVESTLPLAKGGTGATTAAAARTNLGLGAVAADNVVPIVRGGTGAADAPTARTNLGLSVLATTSIVPVANGGTGAADAATARTNLGLGTVAVESTLPVAKGGTGATTPAQARANLGLTNGPTKPRYTRMNIYGTIGTYYDVLPVTSGSGYLNAINVYFKTDDPSHYVSGCNLEITVDGVAQIIPISRWDYNNDPSVAPGTNTGFMPFDVRFNSSLRIRCSRQDGNTEVILTCTWSLD